MRVSRDKVNRLAHAVTDALAARAEVRFLEDHNSVRLAVRQRLEALLALEAKMDEAVRHKIESQQRSILEGTDEWDVLYRKYYQEELKRHGA